MLKIAMGRLQELLSELKMEEAGNMCRLTIITCRTSLGCRRIAVISDTFLLTHLGDLG